MNKSIPILVFLALVTSMPAISQTGTIKGFVYDSSTGQPLPMATITLIDKTLGVISDAGGFFLIPRVPAGSQLVKVSFLGFEDQLQTVTVKSEGVEQLVVNMKPQVYELQSATISAERRRQEHINPVSAHHLNPLTLSKIPGMTGQSDLAEYLQVIPGIIFTGDRGGQFYVRGGEPVQNLVKLDGMTIISPFHSVGFASVFDTEIIGTADVYTAGFGSRYGGRLSSVIDVKTRLGNRREFKSKASASTFGYGFTLEGPLKKMTEKNPSSVSIILSNKGSYIRKTAKTLYPYLDSTGIPFNYNDLYGKVSIVGRKGDQLDLIGMHSADGADYTGLVRSTWENTGGGVRFLVSPSSSNLLFESTLFYSDYRGNFLEPSKRPRTTKYNTLEGMFKMYYNGPVMKLVWGTEMNVSNTLHTFTGTSNLLKVDEYFSTEVFTYLEGTFETQRFLIEPGLRLHYYADKSNFSPEPRLKVRYRINDLLNLNFASGMYSQNLISTNSTEDVMNLFQGYYISPAYVQNTFRGKYIDNKIQLAWHAVLGLSYFGPQNLKLSVEGYVKDYYRMINYNRYRLYDIILDIEAPNDYPEYQLKYFVFEKGWAYGIDFLADWNSPKWNFYLAYSLGYVIRNDEFIQYSPHFDRRHNLNLVFGYKLGTNKNWDLKARWNLGSGFPFTQTYGLYENLVTGPGQFSLDPATSGALNIWYASINGGRFPWYHRLDIAIQRTWKFNSGQNIELAISVMNVYNRQNVFYIDRITMQRINQLPFLPTISLTWRF
jgi:hypothetical protein